MTSVPFGFKCHANAAIVSGSVACPASSATTKSKVLAYSSVAHAYVAAVAHVITTTDTFVN